MKALIATLFFCLFTSFAADAQSLSQYRWKSRVIVVFTPEPSDPIFEEQVRILFERKEDFNERNVVFLFATPEGKFENTGVFMDESFARQYYMRLDPRQYETTLVLIGLDGEEKYRAANRLTPPSVLIDLIDRMPMRRREMLQGTGNKSLGKDDDNTSIPASTRREF